MYRELQPFREALDQDPRATLFPSAAGVDPDTLLVYRSPGLPVSGSPREEPLVLDHGAVVEACGEQLLVGPRDGPRYQLRITSGR